MLGEADQLYVQMAHMSAVLVASYSQMVRIPVGKYAPNKANALGRVKVRGFCYATAAPLLPAGDLRRYIS